MASPLTHREIGTTGRFACASDGKALVTNARAILKHALLPPKWHLQPLLRRRIELACIPMSGQDVHILAEGQQALKEIPSHAGSVRNSQTVNGHRDALSVR